MYTNGFHEFLTVVVSDNEISVDVPLAFPPDPSFDSNKYITVARQLEGRHLVSSMSNI